MRRGLTVGIAAAAALAFVGSASAQPRIFLSTESENPTISAPSLELQPGEESSLYIWVDTDEPVGYYGALSLSVLSDLDGIVERTHFELNNPVLFGALRRWHGESGMETNDELSLFLNHTSVDTSGAGGIPVGTTLHGRIDFVATGPGSTDLWLETGQGNIATDEVPANPFYGVDDVQAGVGAGSRGTSASASITVVPEPGSLVLLGLGGLTLLRRRRA